MRERRCCHVRRLRVGRPVVWSVERTECGGSESHVLWKRDRVRIRWYRGTCTVDVSRILNSPSCVEPAERYNTREMATQTIQRAHSPSSPRAPPAGNKSPSTPPATTTAAPTGEFRSDHQPVTSIPSDARIRSRLWRCGSAGRSGRTGAVAAGRSVDFVVCGGVSLAAGMWAWCVRILR